MTMETRVRFRLVVLLGLSWGLWLLQSVPARGQEARPSLRGPAIAPSPAEHSAPQSAPPQIQLLISSSQPFVAEPAAARILLHIHNPTSQTLWLYRRARGKHPVEEPVQEENQPTKTTGGSTVEVRLQPADEKAMQTAISPAEGTILEYVQMPKPRLIKVAAGADYEETSIVHLRPALAEGQKPIWGAYRLTMLYGASFSNGDQFQRNLGTVLWQGEVTSNAITIELRPALPDSMGVLSGSALGPDLQPRAGIRVSLSDEQGQLIDQQVTGADGQFSFAHLPLALYWVTGRREVAVEDTVTFRHAELTSAAPTATTQLVLYPPGSPEEATKPLPGIGPIGIDSNLGLDAKKFVHKPVLLRVFDPGHQPIGGIELEAIFSSGQVLEDVKAVSGDDGMAVMELLPGRNSFSLKRRGCAEQAERADVATGVGVDCFRFVFDCVKK